jgi:hypothetical protein
MWNSLNNNIRNVDTLSKFKSELNKIDETENHSVPKHFFCGPRKLNNFYCGGDKGITSRRQSTER